MQHPEYRSHVVESDIPEGMTATDYRYRRVSPKRFEILGGPGGYLTCLPVGDERRHDRYRRWIRLGTVNRPLTFARAEHAKGWVLRHCEVR